MKRRLALLFATGCYVGMIPGAPGTYASLLTTVVFYLVHRVGFRIVPELHVSVTCLITALGVLAASEVSRQRGQEDPSMVVVDEVAGQLVTFLFLPVTAVNLIAGFLLFRACDIWKPFPISRLERLGSGVGIVADDLAAGVYANLAVRILHGLLAPGLIGGGS
jgi:phosphatidylglycerophosphatase A